MRRASWGHIALGLGGLLLMTGCQGPTVRVVGMSLEGRPIECRVLGDGADTVLLMATIHGDEPVGTPLLRDLEKHLLDHPRLLAARRVVLMPVANPDGYAHFTRHNVNGVDLNRNFPADNFDASAKHGRSPLSEPESRAIKRVLDEYTPNRIVSIHQPYNVIDYDGPGKALAEAMGRYCEIPVKRVGSRPGSLGSYAGLTLGVPIITLEFDERTHEEPEHILWKKYGPMLLAAVRFPLNDVVMVD
jgi:protein MpaA